MNSQHIFSILSARHRARTKRRVARWAMLAVLLGAPALALPPAVQAEVNIGIGVTIAPPALPVYAQPPAPAPGYIWTPGYWAWGPDGYYWVDGVWLLPPAVDMLWTPGWWGWSDGYYRWHGGYWGPQVGFYGGINYGFGYFGIGYVGGRWRDNHFYYNRAVTNVNITHIRNVYVDKTVIHKTPHKRVSYNGGRGGLHTVPSAKQRDYAAQRHQQLPPRAADRNNAPSSSRPSRPSASTASQRPDDQQRRFNAPPHQASSPRKPDRPQTTPSRPGDSRSANFNRAPNEGRGNRQASGRPADGARATPPARQERPTMNRRPEAAPERPRMDTRPATTPERPRQGFRMQEPRPPRAEAPARQGRQGMERRGEGHSRQGREGR